MRILALLLAVALTSPASFGNSYDPELANVRTWMSRLENDPRQTAREIVEWWYAIGHSESWASQFKIELITLDLVAYYAELHQALTTKTELPLHEEALVHDPYYYGHLRTETFRNYYEEFDQRANKFAVALIENLFAREDADERKGRARSLGPKLVARILRDGREFWFGHILRSVIARRVPISEELQTYARSIPDLGYERFLTAIADHHLDFRGSQSVIDELVAVRTENLQDVPKIGDVRCDSMLTASLRNQTR